MEDDWFDFLEYAIKRSPKGISYFALKYLIKNLQNKEKHWLHFVQSLYEYRFGFKESAINQLKSVAETVDDFKISRKFGDWFIGKGNFKQAYNYFKKINFHQKWSIFYFFLAAVCKFIMKQRILKFF